METRDTVAVVGLGYVGLPLAAAFGARRPTVGFDLDEHKLAAYREGRDPSGEVNVGELIAAAHLRLSSDPAALAEAGIIIVVVPTPIDGAKRPDLGPLEAASRIVGEHLQPGTIVVFESTVYPGCTEEVCVPILEQASGLPWLGRAQEGGEGNSGGDGEGSDGRGFYVGYSPERINPGDRTHRLETITKVVAGDCPATRDALEHLYGSVVEAGIHAAPSIRVAEAAKVIENTQRDLNIALMNELAMIFDRMDIDTLDVLEAAGTKWNFLPFRPGLVGGHCIGVDPYYLTYKAESLGYHPQVVLGGRRINDGMGKFVAEQTVKQLAALGLPISGARVGVLGLTFKENCPDLRNSRVPDIVDELRQYACRVQVHDPLASRDAAREEYGLELVEADEMRDLQALVLAVPHATFLEWSVERYQPMLAPRGLIMDVKGILDRDQVTAAGITLWRL